MPPPPDATVSGARPPALPKSPKRRDGSPGRLTEKIIALTALGKDRPGLVADISEAVTSLGGNIVHVEQSAIYGLFSMLMLIEADDLPPGLDAYRFAYELSLVGRQA